MKHIGFTTYDIQDEIASPDEIPEAQHRSQVYRGICSRRAFTFLTDHRVKLECDDRSFLAEPRGHPNKNNLHITDKRHILRKGRSGFWPLFSADIIWTISSIYLFFLKVCLLFSADINMDDISYLSFFSQSMSFIFRYYERLISEDMQSSYIWITFFCQHFFIT